MKVLVVIAGLYNLLWGLLLFLLPGVTFGFEDSLYITLTRSWMAGLMVVFGIGYLIAAKNLYKNWMVVLLGLIMKIVLPVFLLSYIPYNAISPKFWIVILGNYVIWWLPFGYVLYKVFEHKRKLAESINYFYSTRVNVNSLNIRTNGQASVAQLSEKRPLMLVFLRHFGCTFCRETLRTLARKKEIIEAMGTRIALVHMMPEEKAALEVKKYGLEEVYRISDPACKLYDQFALEKGSFTQLFGLKVLLRGFKAGLIDRNFIGGVKGDPAQLPGVFLLYQGDVVKSYKHYTAADTPDYLYLANCESC